MIADATQWRLVIRIGNDSLYILALPLCEASTFVYRKLPMDMTLPSALKAFENVVYDNPLLLSDFGRIDCLVDTSKYIITPFDDTSTEEECSRLLKKIYHYDDDSVALSSAILPNIYFLTNKEFIGFLRRTFFNVRISHQLSPLICYFTGNYNVDNIRLAEKNNSVPQYADAAKRMFVNFRDRILDVIVTGSNNLLLANSYSFDQPEDIAYYLLAIRENLSLDPENDPILYSGNSDLTDTALEIIKRYVRNIEPLQGKNIVYENQDEFCEIPMELISMIRL